MFKSVPGGPVPGCIEGIPGHYGMFGGIMGCSGGVPGFTDTPDLAVVSFRSLPQRRAERGDLPVVFYTQQRRDTQYQSRHVA